MSRNFYVYEHWRPDTDTCFYVGKGYGKRAYNFAQRNAWHTAVVAKLARSGLEPEVRIVVRFLCEGDAFLYETLLIEYWREQEHPLTNLTDGGDGTAGLKWSEESRRRRSELNKLLLTPELRARISASLKGRVPTDHERVNHKEAMRKRRGEKKPPLSEEARKKIGDARSGAKHSDETKRKMSESHKGKKRSPETRAKMSAAAKVAQKARFEREMATVEGREKIKAKMCTISNGAKSNADYLETKRRAGRASAEVRWGKKAA